MLDFQQQLDQFFQGNDRGYPRDPRRMAYAKLRKNTLGMDREQLEAFIDANLMIPFSQYKMALGNLIKFIHKYDEMNKLNEIDQFKKLAGLLKEDEVGSGTDYDESSDSESDDTDAMGGIDEAGNMKGIKIEIPGNSNAVDFGKAAAREVVESFGPREYRNFLEAFLNEFKKITGGV
jgi:hypothetical protein